MSKKYILIGRYYIKDKLCATFEQVFETKNYMTSDRAIEEAIVQAMYLESINWKTEIKETI